MDKVKIEIPFKLVHIEENQFSLFENGLGSAEISQEVGVGFDAIVEKHILASSIQYKLISDQGPFINIVVTCYFEIEPSSFSSFYTSDDMITIPQGFSQHLAMITAGTARGILFAKTKGTEFNTYYMGLINIPEFIDQDIIIELKKG